MYKKPSNIIALLTFFLLPLATANAPAQTNTNSSPWEPEIRAFEKSDKTNLPPRNAILFTGSSSIRKWTTLAQDFPGFDVINRGFGGSQIQDSTEFAERIIFPYHPRMIVFYAGDNDLAAGKSADEVAAEYKEFVRKVRTQLPQTPIAFISIKPCPLRWHLKDKVAEANRQIAALKADHLIFIDVYSHMLDADGKPPKDLFLADGLHPSKKCYDLWASLIKPYLNSR